MNLRNYLLAFGLFAAGLTVQAQNNQQYLSYIAKYKDLAIEQMKAYHIPASITLAQGLFESGAGMSELAVNSNNHFGIKCGSNWTGLTIRHDDDARQECFRVYSNVRASYEDHSKFLLGRSRYASLFTLKETDYKGWAHGLKKAGYATNPQYAQRLIDIIEKYKLYLYDTPVEGGGYFEYGSKVATTPKLINVANSDRDVKLNNGLLLVVARRGETMASLAKEFGIKEKKLLKYNDMYTGYQLSEGEWVYLQKKKRMASREFFRQMYTIKEGDSMFSIAQAFGVRLKNLYKMNRMSPGDNLPAIGTPIRIR